LLIKTEPLTRLKKPPLSASSLAGLPSSAVLFNESFGSFSCLPMALVVVVVGRKAEIQLKYIFISENPISLTIESFLFGILLLLILGRQHGDTTSWLLLTRNKKSENEFSLRKEENCEFN